MDFCSISSYPIVINTVLWKLWLNGDDGEPESYFASPTVVSFKIADASLLLGCSGSKLIIQLHRHYQVQRACEYLITSEGVLSQVRGKNLKSFVVCQYRNFDFIDDHLQGGRALNKHLFFSLSDHIYKYLSCSYYHLDPKVARHFIGKKLCSKLKKQFDTARYRKLASKRKFGRIYDNLKRIYKVIEAQPVDPVQYIARKFNLTEDISRGYTAITFMCYHRIDVSHKCTNYLTFHDLLEIIRALMDDVTVPNFPNSEEYYTILPKICRSLRRHITRSSALASQIEEAANEHMNASEVHNTLGQQTLAFPKIQYLVGTLSIGRLLSSRKLIKSLILKIQEKAVDIVVARKLPIAEYSVVIDALMFAIKKAYPPDILCKYGTDDVLLAFIKGIGNIVKICLRANDASAVSVKASETTSVTHHT